MHTMVARHTHYFGCKNHLIKELLCSCFVNGIIHHQESLLIGTPLFKMNKYTLGIELHFPIYALRTNFYLMEKGMTLHMEENF